MQKAAVTCPSCAGTLALTAWTPGRQMRCPRCTTVFRLGTTPGTASPVHDTAPATTTTPPALPTPQPTPNRAGLLAAVVGGLALFIGGTIGLAVLVANAEKKPEPPPVAQNNPTPTPTPPPNPGPVVPVTTPTPPVPAPRLSADLQEKVDRAIDQGLTFLRAQNPNADGSAFLLGLTLLECGVSKDDPQVKKIAQRVRDYAKPTNTIRTYETALALLILDRLGEADDRATLRSLGLRLLAGQQTGGGWDYPLPKLSSQAEVTFYAVLQQARPEKAGELYLREKAGQYLDVSGRSIKEDALEVRALKDIEVGYNKLLGVQDDLKKHPELRNVPSLRINEEPTPPRPGGRPPKQRPFAAGPGDNSNTQFAALGLWVAARHGIPCERSLALLAARFRTSQSSGGGWNYHVTAGQTATMTCAGLLALAVGHGVRVEDADQKREDDQIARALAALADYLKDDGNARNLYFMWSLERVGLLFGLEKIGTTDWYEWGAKRLVASQSKQGTWQAHLGPLHDTCFALLFLKRGNLVSDLSTKLDRVLDIKSLRRQD